jgi:hypothetical protein
MHWEKKTGFLDGVLTIEVFNVALHVIGTAGPFTKNKAAGASKLPLILIKCRG